MTTSGLLLDLRVSPGAKKNQILGRYGEKQIKLSVKCPPVDGKANQALIKFLSEIFFVPQKNVELVSGESSRSKKIFIHGETQALRTLLEQYLSQS